MNKQELIKKFEERKTIIGNFQGSAVWWEDIKEIFEELDEPEAGHAEEAPRYVKNVLARLRELPAHDREVWLKAIMSEFEQDFSHAIWREVEKEPKYKVKFKGVLKNNNYLNYNSEIKIWYHASSLEIGIVRTKFTRKELEEAGFGWVFDCEGVEVEEVDE